MRKISVITGGKHDQLTSAPAFIEDCGKDRTLGKRPSTAVSLALERSKEWFNTLPEFVKHVAKVRWLHRENLPCFLKIKKCAGHALTICRPFLSSLCHCQRAYFLPENRAAPDLPRTFKGTAALCSLAKNVQPLPGKAVLHAAEQARHQHGKRRGGRESPVTASCNGCCSCRPRPAVRGRCPVPSDGR